MANIVKICTVNDVPDGQARRFNVDGHRVAVVRIGEQFYAIGDRCSHANFSLSQGMVWPEQCALECPQHSSSFDLATGRPNSLPATASVPVYEIRRTGDDGSEVELVLPEDPL